MMSLQLSPSRQAGLIAFLQDLVRTPSLSTQEGAVAARAMDELRRLGLTDGHIDRIGNVVTRLGSGRPPILLYNAHMDIVGVGDPAAWQRDPFGAVIEDGVLYGRGASDTKAALAAMTYGAGLLRDAGVQLNGTLVLAFVVQEEPCEGLAMRTLVEDEGLRPDWVVLGEPSNLRVARGHRGRVEIEVSVRGRSVHGSAPERGVNAIYQAVRVITGLEKLAGRLGDDSFLGRGSLAVTEITSLSGSRNVVPDRCTLIVDRRLTLGETEQHALAEVEQVIAVAGVEAFARITDYVATSYTGYPCHARNVFPAWTTPEDHPLVQAAARAVEVALGFRPAIGRWDFSTDGAYTAGGAGIPTVGFGPGDERYPHTVDDQVRLDDVVKAAQVYAQLAVELLGESRPVIRDT
jgi:putative selenium metabolism hydrolase